MKLDYPDIYRKHFVENGDEILGLFRLLVEKFSIEAGLYPGSFVHITPSFVIPQIVYVDIDERCESFFKNEKTRAFVDKNKEYGKPAYYSFHKKDFSEGFPEKVGSFDILISLYAGFISKYCGEYLKKGKILLANNSHGDAPLAYLDKRYELIGVVTRKKNRKEDAFPRENMEDGGGWKTTDNREYSDPAQILPMIVASYILSALSKKQITGERRNLIFDIVSVKVV